MRDRRALADPAPLSSGVTPSRKSSGDVWAPRFHLGRTVVASSYPMKRSPLHFSSAHNIQIRSARDDLKRSETNRACSIITPDSLPTWRHLSLLGSKVSAIGTPTSYFKTDRGSAYNCLPPQPARPSFAATTLRSPHDKERHGFRPKSRICGAKSAVIH